MEGDSRNVFAFYLEGYMFHVVLALLTVLPASEFIPQVCYVDIGGNLRSDWGPGGKTGRCSDNISYYN